MVLRTEDIMQLLDIKKTKAYEIIKKLNAELESKGYMTCRGRVPREYFLERFNLKG